jgi:DNA-binding MarR family transcriptional regulator
VKNILDNLNRVFENRARLGIMSVLVVNDRVDFNSLKETMGLTDGNLATHISVLERHRYIEVKKEFVGRKPMTTYNATRKGREAFAAHIDALEKIVKRSS